MKYEDLVSGTRIEVERFWNQDTPTWEPGTILRDNPWGAGKIFEPDNPNLINTVVRSHRMDEVRMIIQPVRLSDLDERDGTEGMVSKYSTLRTDLPIT